MPGTSTAANTPLRLHVERLVAGGAGLGRMPDGLVVLVAGVLPGEEVLVRLRRRHKSFLEATLLDILHPAPERVAPPCQMAGTCGGCDLIHASPALQGHIKENLLAEALSRAGVILPSECLLPLIPSPQTLGYRNRLRLHLDHQGRTGMRRAGSSEVVPLSSCPVAAPALNVVLERLQDNPGLLDARWQRFDVQLSPADDLVYGHLRLPFQPDRAVFKRLERLAHAAGLRDIAITPETSATSWRHMGLRPNGLPYCRPQMELPRNEAGRFLRLSWEAGSFCQINTCQNERLVLEVCRLARPSATVSLLDLFCGMGNLSLPLADRGAQVLGCELDADAVCRASENARRNGLSQGCRFVAAPVTVFLDELVRQQHRFEVVVCDPPRQGLDRETPAALDRLRPQRIIAVSCDPATLARDLKRLSDLGYHLSSCQPLDMFPQTSHVETLVLLEKSW